MLTQYVGVEMFSLSLFAHYIWCLTITLIVYIYLLFLMSSSRCTAWMMSVACCLSSTLRSQISFTGSGSLFSCMLGESLQHLPGRRNRHLGDGMCLIVLLTDCLWKKRNIGHTDPRLPSAHKYNFRLIHRISVLRDRLIKRSESESSLLAERVWHIKKIDFIVSSSWSHSHITRKTNTRGR